MITFRVRTAQVISPKNQMFVNFADLYPCREESGGPFFLTPSEISSHPGAMKVHAIWACEQPGPGEPWCWERCSRMQVINMG